MREVTPTRPDLLTRPFLWCMRILGNAYVFKIAHPSRVLQAVSRRAPKNSLEDTPHLLSGDKNIGGAPIGSAGPIAYLRAPSTRRAISMKWKRRLAKLSLTASCESASDLPTKDCRSQFNPSI